MSEIKAVLLVPEADDPFGLLKEGPCGARPPMARKFGLPRLMHTSNEFADPTYNGEKCVACGQPWPCDTPGEVEQVADEKWVPWPHAVSSPCALVLAWDGEPVWAGIDLVDRAVRRSTASGTVMAALRRGIVLESDLPGTLVLIDADAREVKDEVS